MTPMTPQNCPKYVSPAEAVRLVKSGDTIVVQGSTSIPTVLLDALTARASELRDVKLISGFGIHPEDAPYAKRELMDSFRALSIFVPNTLRKAMREGVADTIPAFLGEVPFLFRSRQIPVDVTFLNVSEPDEEGYCSFGISADIAFSGAECSRVIIAQVNKYMPRTFGDPVIHISKISAMCRGDVPLVEVPTPVPNEIETKIGNYVASEIPDGATLQLGLGKVSTAIGYDLRQRNDLGIFSELFSQPMMMLMKNGNVTNKCKGFMDGMSVFSFSEGTQEMYDFMDRNPEIYGAPFPFVNDARNIAQNKRMFSINSAMGVNLYGEVAADAIGYRQQSAVGGQLDFVKGAQWSEGGKSIIVLSSSFMKDGKRKSKISLQFAPGTPVTTPRSEVQYVATEYGCVNLKILNMSDRVRALISLAHPDFRDQLTQEAKDCGLI